MVGETQSQWNPRCPACGKVVAHIRVAAEHDPRGRYAGVMMRCAACEKTVPMGLVPWAKELISTSRP